MSSIDDAFRRRALDRAAALAGQAELTRFTVFVTTVGAGQVTHDVSFPVTFTEVPGLSRSWHLEEGQVLAPNAFPTVEVGAHYFMFDEPQPGIRLYRGARLLIVTTGKDDQRIIVHCHFDGTALASPTAQRQII